METGSQWRGPPSGSGSARAVMSGSLYGQPRTAQMPIQPHHSTPPFQQNDRIEHKARYEGLSAPFQYTRKRQIFQKFHIFLAPRSPRRRINLCSPSSLMKDQHANKRKTWQRGLTLVELLVVLTIIATLAAIIYPAIIDSMKKSQAAMIADRLDAIQKAKVQYQLDAEAAVSPSPTPFPDSAAVDFNSLRKYLLRFGQQLNQPGDLDQGTGGRFDLGIWGGGPSFKPDDPSSNPYIAKYNIPISSPSATPAGP
jgi:prepilin-type N-terminal cleavage/methylation domain-containing protein